MALATVVKPGATFYLQLDEAEALYVHSALRQAAPAGDQFADGEDEAADPVHSALSDALRAAGLPTHEFHARPH